jgi:hypothetical protein
MPQLRHQRHWRICRIRRWSTTIIPAKSRNQTPITEQQQSALPLRRQRPPRRRLRMAVYHVRQLSTLARISLSAESRWMSHAAQVAQVASVLESQALQRAPATWGTSCAQIFSPAMRMPSARTVTRVLAQGAAQQPKICAFPIQAISARRPILQSSYSGRSSVSLVAAIWAAMFRLRGS